MHPDMIINKTFNLTFNCNGETLTMDFENVEFKNNIEYEEHPFIPYRMEKERSMNCNIELTQPLDENLIGAITNVKDIDDYNDFGLTFNIQVQARKHKKKRINKKWLKRYGTRYYTVTVPYAKYLSQDDNKVYFMAVPEKKV